jgi:diguanylate cyclase
LKLFHKAADKGRTTRASDRRRLFEEGNTVSKSVSLDLSALWSLGKTFVTFPKSIKGTLLIFVLSLQLVQAIALLSHVHALWISNAVQVLLPILVFCLCLLRRNEQESDSNRKDWSKLAIAFFFWTVAEVLYLMELYVFRGDSTLKWPDDVLWLLFALPILLATSGPPEGEIAPFSWLDHGQAFLFFAILLVSVFCKPHIFPFDTAYNFQNVSLLLSCALRASVTTTPSGARFYRDLGEYLIVYTFCAWIGNALQASGWQPGSIVDLCWTIPMTLFCFLVSRGAQPWAKASNQEAPWIWRWRRHVRGLSALALAVLSIGASAVVISRRPLFGWICMVGTFTLFATRTVVKELDLYKAHDEMKATALRDALTGLGNRLELRRYLVELVSRSERKDSSVAVFFIDLDRFKAINDEFGHEAGDRLLVEVSIRLQRAVKIDDLICRLGGDEFIIVMDLVRTDSPKLIGQRLLEEINSPITIGDRSLLVTASIGMVLGVSTESVEDLLRNADHAMYRAKKLGKNQVQLFDRSMSVTERLDATLETDLHEYLGRDDIEVAFQPICSLNDKVIVGFEALARWTHLVRGAVSPGEFIPLAEESGLICKLGMQVLEKACRQVALWNATYGLALFASVNVSARQFSDPQLLPCILQRLQKAGLPPHLLHLEITESVLLVGQQSVKKMLTDARAVGIQVSLDDFGTGHSSLSYLLDFPVDEIKIDRSFIHNLHLDPRRTELVRSVLGLGQTLGKRVIAEGVEVDAEYERLAEMDCRFIQGFIVSKPLAQNEVHKLLSLKPGRDCEGSLHEANLSPQVNKPRGEFGKMGLLEQRA